MSRDLLLPSFVFRIRCTGSASEYHHLNALLDMRCMSTAAVRGQWVNEVLGKKIYTERSYEAVLSGQHHLSFSSGELPDLESRSSART